MIPSAASLAVLCDTSADHVDVAGQPITMDRTSAAYLMLVTDSIAVRARGTVMAEAVVEAARSTTLRAGQDLHWLSIAAGTALPAMKAAVRAGLRPRLGLVDLDRTALARAHALAAVVGFAGTIETERVNIFDPQQMTRLGARLVAADRAPHLIDAMGIFEYTGPDLGVDPVAFLAPAYAMLRPGGTLIIGQMRDDRPLADFTLGVIGWPHVTMRSPAELMAVLVAAGITPSEVELVLPDDGVYMVAVVREPATEAPAVIVLP